MHLHLRPRLQQHPSPRPLLPSTINTNTLTLPRTRPPTTTTTRKTQTHPFHTSSPLSKTPQLPPRPTLPTSTLKHVYLKGSGPGGQKINKTSSAVQLTHLPTGIVVKSQATRSQKQNHNIARKILAEKVELLEKGGESRAAKKVELMVKRKRGAGKKKRRKYRRLAGEGGKGDEEEGVEEGEGESEEGESGDGGGEKGVEVERK